MRRETALGWVEEFAEKVPVENRRVLDAGSGSGKYSLLLRHAGAQVVGLDIDEVCARATHSLCPAAVRASVTSLPFHSSTFQVVVLRYVLHQVPRDAHDLVLSEAYRVLSTDGVLFIETTDSLHAAVNEDVRQFKPLQRRLEQVHRRSEDLRAAVRQHGFSVEYHGVLEVRPDYPSVDAALERSENLVTNGVGPTPWLLLDSVERRQLHQARQGYLRQMYGSGPAPRVWGGYQLIGTKAALA